MDGYHQTWKNHMENNRNKNEITTKTWHIFSTLWERSWIEKIY